MGKVKTQTTFEHATEKNVKTIQNWVRRGFYRTIKYLISYKYELQVTSTSYKLIYYYVKCAWSNKSTIQYMLQV
jgi:hypothetical protein